MTTSVGGAGGSGYVTGGVYQSPPFGRATGLVQFPSLMVHDRGNSIKMRKLPPFQKALIAMLKEGTPDAEMAIKHLGGSSPIYGDALRKEYLNLCLLAQKPRVQFEAMLLQAKLAERIPGKIGKARAKMFLSSTGFAFLDHMAEKYPRFKPYWDLFQSQKVRAQAAKFLVTKSMGGEPELVREINEFNEVESARIAAEEAAAYQTALFQQQATQQAYLATVSSLTASQWDYGISLIGSDTTPIQGVAQPDQSNIFNNLWGSVKAWGK